MKASTSTSKGWKQFASLGNIQYKMPSTASLSPIAIVKPFFVATRYITFALPRMSCSLALSTYHSLLKIPFPSSLRSPGLNMTSSCFQNSTDGSCAVKISSMRRTTTAGHRQLKVLVGFVGEERCGILRWVMTLCDDCKHPVSPSDQLSGSSTSVAGDIIASLPIFACLLDE